jgi:hypothetical protein
MRHIYTHAAAQSSVVHASCSCSQAPGRRCSLTIRSSSIIRRRQKRAPLGKSVAHTHTGSRIEAAPCSIESRTFTGTRTGFEVVAQPRGKTNLKQSLSLTPTPSIRTLWRSEHNTPKWPPVAVYVVVRAVPHRLHIGHWDRSKPRVHSDIQSPRRPHPHPRPVCVHVTGGPTPTTKTRLS